LIKNFCEDVDKWLSSAKNNVAAVHCKAGKGRTGVMGCCYLIHVGVCETAEAALNLYADKRTYDKKGVTIPSQRRYVHYYEKLVKSGTDYKKTPLFLKSIIIEPIPSCNKSNCIPSILVYEGKNIKVNKSSSWKRFDHCIILELDPGYCLLGDIKVEFFNGKAKSEKIFTFWLNTYFVKLINTTCATNSCSCTFNTDIMTFSKSSDKSSFSAINHYKCNPGCCITSSPLDTSPTNNSSFKLIKGIANNLNSNSANSRSSMYEYPSSSSSTKSTNNNNNRIRSVTSSNLHNNCVQDKRYDQ